MSEKNVLALKTVVSQNPAFYLGMVDDEHMLMNIYSGEVHSLNWVATKIWEQAAKPVSLATLQEWMMDEFGLDAVRSETDLLALCNNMVLYETLLIDKGDYYESSL